MRGDSQHQIVMLGVHLLHIGTRPFPERAQPRDGVLVGAFHRDQKAPAVVEELGKAAARAGMLGPRQRVAGDKMHAIGQMRPDLRDHVGLDRTHIRHRGTRRKMRRDLGGHGAHDTHRHAEHHQIGARDSLGGTVADPVAEADLARRGAGLVAAGIAGDFARQTAALHRPEQRGGDQPQPDQGDPVIDLRHQLPPLNCRTAWTTRRQALSSPTVMRRQLGRL